MKTSIILFVLLVSAVNSWGWWDKSTHKILTENAANRYFNPIDFNYLEKDITLEGSTKKATFWLQDGSELEDESNILGIPTRSLNHFHNPTKSLEAAGLDDTFSGMSALLWAQTPTEQAKVTQGGNWTWQKVREHQYNYLTAPDQTSHDANQARMLKGLGYQMHLVHDMSQPNHVRNDAHILDGKGMKTSNGFETWAKSKDKWIKDLLANPATTIPDVTVDMTKPFIEPTLAPIPVARLYDTREQLTNGVITPSTAMSQGLAEYTNANFFSEDTVFAAERYAVGNDHYFPYPQKNETDLQDFVDEYMDPVPGTTANGTSYLKFVIKKLEAKTSGEPLACLAMPGPNTRKFFKEYGGATSAMFYGSFRYDAKCYEEHAKLLIPRTVAYSKAMLDYFFRGKIKLEIAGTDNSNSLIHLKATNVTANNEQMPAGDVSLVLRYRLTQANDQPTSIMEGGGYEYKVFPKTGQSAIPTGNGTEFTFDISADPLPDWANDVTAQLVYRGQLGNEAGAIAVGSLPIKVKSKAILISVPDSGAYAVSNGTQQFKQITLKAKTELPDGLNASGGVFQLVIIHRFSASDPYQGSEVATLPTNQNSYYVIRANELSGINSLSTGVAQEMSFDITATPIPLTASDVHIFLVYKKAGDPDTKSVAVGYLDISEPTPIDVYNNTDKVCLNGQWYDAGSAGAMAIADTNHDGYADLTDIYRHQINNIYYKPGSGSTAGSGNFLLSSTTPLEPGTGRRLGYILSDYYFSHSMSETVTDLDLRDNWELAYSNLSTSAEGYVNQHNMGNMQGYSGMYNMRGYKMHGGAGYVFDNQEYPDGVKCSWDLLNTPPTP